MTDRIESMQLDVDELRALRQRVKELENAPYLSQAHALCNDLGIAPGHIENRLFEAIGKVDELAALKAGQGDPVAWQDIVSALKAVDAEAWERGRMFPQHSDEQDADRAAIRRACELVEWYSTKGGSVAMHLPLWPKHPAPAQTITESWVPVPMVAIDGCRDDILNGRGALEEVLDNDQTNAVLAVFDQYFDGAAPKEPPHA